jgi:hypothetical protein
MQSPSPLCIAKKIDKILFVKRKLPLVHWISPDEHIMETERTPLVRFKMSHGQNLRLTLGQAVENFSQILAGNTEEENSNFLVYRGHILSPVLGDKVDSRIGLPMEQYT